MSVFTRELGTEAPNIWLYSPDLHKARDPGYNIPGTFVNNLISQAHLGQKSRYMLSLIWAMLN